MSQKPIIAVVGATGAQGGSVVKFLLANGGFQIRGITRNVNSEKAQALVAKGVELAKADLDDVPSLTEAFKGAYGVFGVTNFWEHQSAEKEVQQGKNLVDAAKAAGVKHFIWSTLEYTQDPVVPHANSKAEVDDYLKSKGVPHTSLYTAFYFENFVYLFPLKEDNGAIVADWPLLMTDGPIGGYAAEETGAFVVEALTKPDHWLGRDLKIQSEIFTPRQLVDVYKQLSGKDIQIKEVSRAAFEAAKNPHTEEIWANMELFYKANGNPGRDLELTKTIYPQRQTLAKFVKNHLDAYPLLK